ncbi:MULTISPECIES: flagellar motor protein MotB [Marinobacter]|uniref:Motility protein B n=1 Tax=Marinobacter salarius TaxID=1420917 RepID=A0A1W6K4B9_9GAMM|nr:MULTISPECIES: flagellar motor protein MotB [Marinobacter]ARM82273.1 motility protein B [Marinobacter salarius]AZR41122.1 putative 24.6 kDa protein in ccpA 3'region [Marinobacter salarius]MAB53305.1 type VI secretion system protein TssL [Marinobacter sp.]MCZ4285347.1 OmpA family protein [Marinobacter salarius]MDC8454115.1 OmpA family protein [Marinobacter sp. DS40M6]
MVVRQPVKKKKHGRGSPAWIVTFADLATLLLTFFILLLSFAEMDVEKYRAMANSMAVAFGSNQVLGDAVGGSPLTLIESDTVSLPEPMETATDEPEFIDERAEGDAPTKIPAGVIDLASRMIEELEPEVASEALSVNYDESRVVIRFSEEATFRSGEAAIKPGMVPIIERVVEVLSGCTGDVLVAGYTDDRPIASGRYRSNWDLSAARAVSVVHELVLNRQVPAERVVAAGRAETNPLAPNDSPENRAKNRRVEIAIRNPQCDDSVETDQLPVEINP